MAEMTLIWNGDGVAGRGGNEYVEPVIGRVIWICRIFETIESEMTAMSSSGAMVLNPG